MCNQSMHIQMLLLDRPTNGWNLKLDIQNNKKKHIYTTNLTSK